MRILLASTRGAGHIGPLVPFALACRRAGHEVLMAAPRSAWEHVARVGLPFAGVDDPPAEELDPLWAGVRECDPADVDRYVLEEIFAGAFARAALPGMLALVRRWRPDVILRESSDFASLVAAERLDVPELAVECFLARPDSVDWELGEPLARLGLRAPVDVNAPYLTLAPRSLDAERPGALRFRAPDGRTEPLPNWGRERRPLVYLSFGSAAAGNGFFPDLYRAAAEAMRELDANVLLTLGTQVDPYALGPVPENVHVERWVPQGRVMPHAAAMIGHGGSRSPPTPMGAGVPLGAIPLFADQPQTARGVDAVGAGVALESADGLAGVVGRLLDEPRFWFAAQRVRSEIAALAPIDEVVPLLREFARGEAIAA